MLRNLHRPVHCQVVDVRLELMRPSYELLPFTTLPVQPRKYVCWVAAQAVSSHSLQPGSTRMPSDKRKRSRGQQNISGVVQTYHHPSVRAHLVDTWTFITATAMAADRPQCSTYGPTAGP